MVNAPISPLKTHSLNGKLTSRAIKSLCAYSAKQSASKGDTLLDSENKNLLVQFTLDKVPSNSSNKPHRLSVPHRPLPSSVADEADYTVCIIVKDGSKEWVQETLEEQGDKLGYVKKILTLSKIRRDFKQHQQRRDLLRTYTTFLADDR